MGTRDPRVDDYSARSADFARPVLAHLREVVHAACPDVNETLKWGMPHFMHNGVLCGMASFKQHCALRFWKGALLFGEKEAGQLESEAMGQFGRITKLSDLPSSKVLLGYIKEMVRLNDAGIKVPAKAKPKEKKELVVPDYFIAALKKNKKAMAAFEAFSYSHRKEYVEWVTEAKRDETRSQRLKTTVEWLAAGKPRNWKYVNC